MSFGRPYILNIDGCIHDGWLVIQDYQNNFDQHYLYYALCSDATMAQYKSMAAGSSVQNLSKEKVADIVLPKPPLPEQRAIAEVLSDMDSYIASLEKLIAKKRAVKQGAMQDLLSGKRRLPGFAGEWISINLAQKSILKARIGWQGLTTAEYQNDGYAFLITGTDFLDGRINWVSCHFVDKFRYDQDTNIQIKNNDVLLTKDGTIGKVVLVEGLTKNATLNSGVFVIRPINHAYDNLFIYFILTSEIFISFLTKLSAGSTINHLYQKDFIDFEFLAPPTIEEQKAITQMLLNMDAEIDALSARLNKTKLIKQGMMRELLTGRIRLVKPETTAVPATKVVEFPKNRKAAKSHNQAIEDAVILGVITDLYATEQYPLAPFYSQKLSYLLHRHIEGKAEGYTKKAAGPYNPAYKYKTALPIALKNNYVIGKKATYKGKSYLNLVVGSNIDKAKNYFRGWHGEEPLKWLEQFRYIKNRRDELELLTTVDMAMVELRNNKKQIIMSTVKGIIKNSDAWKAKLKRGIFSDENITRAIEWSIILFGEEE
jgi:type I restriction enzyme S subunit